MKTNPVLLFIVLLFLNTSCGVFQKSAGIKDDGKLEVVFVQVNDVYEIAPLNGGKEGGMARVATVKKLEKIKNDNTYLVMGGDFLSPSVYNSLKYEGQSIRGKQMIEAMNSAGMDYVVFGNHEFDIKENELQSRIDESDFTWISSNTFHKTSDGVQAFKRNSTRSHQSFPETLILNLVDKDGTEAKVGIIALTLPFNKVPYVHYTDPIETAKKLYNQIKDSVDVVVALTHLELDEDIKLAIAIPELGLIMGGHEHDMRSEMVGNVPIVKAHANAKSAFINTVLIYKKSGKSQVKTRLQYIDETILADSLTEKVVEKWVKIADDNYSSLGFDAHKIILAKTEPLEGRESYLRAQPTNLTKMVICGMEAAAPLADLAIVNAGAIRIDDVLHAPLSQYDILRSMPFGGGIREVEMKGSLLNQILTVGEKNKGKGGYLLHSEKVSAKDDVWSIEGSIIESDKIYRVAMLDFLLSGMEMNLGFLTDTNSEIVHVFPAETAITNPLSDIRLALVQYLESMH